MRREAVCDSDIIMADLLEPQFLFNTLHEKIVSQNYRYITEPFKQTYAIKELKNLFTERLNFRSSDYSKISSLPNNLSYSLAGPIGGDTSTF
jgi:hypothetical protein